LTVEERVERWLKDYDFKCAELDDIEIQLTDVKERYDPESIPAVDPSRDFIKAGEVKSGVEVKVIKYVDKVRELEERKAKAESYLKRVENALKVLNPDERDIVERCVMSSGRCTDVFFKRTRFYEIKKNALKKISKVISV
jgi:hypothetical protein